jgi:hypothetical protein
MKENSPKNYTVETEFDSFSIKEMENETEIYMNGNLIYIENNDILRFFPQNHIVNTPKNQYILTEKEKNISIYKNGILIKKLTSSSPFKSEVCSGDCDNDDLCESSCIKKAHSLSSSIGEKK